MYRKKKERLEQLNVFLGEKRLFPVSEKDTCGAESSPRAMRRHVIYDMTLDEWFADVS